MKELLKRNKMVTKLIDHFSKKKKTSQSTLHEIFFFFFTIGLKASDMDP